MLLPSLAASGTSNTLWYQPWLWRLGFLKVLWAVRFFWACEHLMVILCLWQSLLRFFLSQCFFFPFLTVLTISCLFWLVVCFIMHCWKSLVFFFFFKSSAFLLELCYSCLEAANVNRCWMCCTFPTIWVYSEELSISFKCILNWLYLVFRHLFLGVFTTVGFGLIMSFPGQLKTSASGYLTSWLRAAVLMWRNISAVC